MSIVGTFNKCDPVCVFIVCQAERWPKRWHFQLPNLLVCHRYLRRVGISNPTLEILLGKLLVQSFMLVNQIIIQGSLGL